MTRTEAFMRRTTMSVVFVCAVPLIISDRAFAQCEPRWEAIGPGPGLRADSIGPIFSWDPDGPGPMPPELLCSPVNNFSPPNAAGQLVVPPARWDGTAWSSMVPQGLTSLSYRFAMWDSDGTGPHAASLVAVLGLGTIVNDGLTVQGVGRWDGSRWLPIGTGLSSPTGGMSIIAWDPDGDGPQPETLIVGGDSGLKTGEGESLWGIARWTGDRWISMVPASSSVVVHSLFVWDPDRAGPEPAQLLAAGRFWFPFAFSADMIRWDGSQWRPISPVHPGGLGLSMTAWDPDGNGPLPSRLIVGGLTVRLGQEYGGLFSWDGSVWTNLLPGPNMAAYPTVWDSDGPGPRPPQLIAFGQPTLDGGQTTTLLARYDGSSWSAFDVAVSGRNAVVHSAGVWDPDGDGPAPAELIVGGRFERVNGVEVNNIVRVRPCVPCRADFDGDGFVDFFDLSSFFACFDGEPCPDGRTADVNADGFVDFFDLDAFLAAFETGC